MTDSPRKPKLSNAGRKPLANYYRGSTSSSQTSPFDKKLVVKKNPLIAKLLDAVVITLLLFLFVYSLLVSPNPRVSVSNLDYRSIGEYKAATTKLTNSLGNRTKITFNDQFIANNLQKKYPEIRNVVIELPLIGQTPIVRLDISAPSFFLSANANVFVIDSDGVAVAQKFDLPGVSSLPIINDQSGFNVQVGKQVLSTSQARFVNVLLEQLNHANVPVKALVLPVSAQELDLQTKDRPYYTKFFLAGDPLLESGQFLAARHQFDATNQQPSEYLDVRVAGKVFSK